MSPNPVNELARRINATDARKAVAYIAGGGTEVLPMLLAHGGGSATLLSARIPYSANDFRAVLGYDPGRFVDARAARALAMSAFRHALTIRGDLSHEAVFGLGSTSKLAKDHEERDGRTHEIHAAVQTSCWTCAWSVKLPDGGDRAWEERINALLLLNLFAFAKDVDLQLPLEHDGRSVRSEAVEESAADWHECRHFGLPDLLVGKRLALAYDFASESDIREAAVDTGSARLILPGSFRPLHAGHIAMAEAASKLTGLACDYEISLFHPEKPPLDYLAIWSRLKGFVGHHCRLYLTNAPTYVEKARLFPGSTFAVGHDTALRIIDPRYYAGAAGRDAILEELESLGTRFLIFGRVDASGNFRDFRPEDFEHPVAGFLTRLAIPVPGHVFRVDLSSTEIRERSGEDYA